MAQATLSTTERSAVPAIGQTRLFVNSAWVYPLDSTCFNTLKPATDEVIASVAQGALPLEEDAPMLYGMQEAV